MPDDPRVQQILDQLLDSDVTPEEACKSCVELLPTVRDRWRQICHARAAIDAMFPQAAEGSTAYAPSTVDGAVLPVIPGYEMDSILGRGGMGIVFLARHLQLNRFVALKMAIAGAYAGPQERARFQREAEAVAGLRHSNVVQVHDVGESDGRPYFTMEYVEGGSLAQKLAGTPQAAREAAALLATLAAAVQAAHQAGIVHRDLKPANILLTADGTPKVSDFGLARRLSNEAGLTRTGAAMGTPSYMAPEQAGGKSDAAGPPADIYALGTILYELLTGRPPFRAETASETLHQLLSEQPVPPSRLNAKVPRDLETICLKCLQKEPRLRYTTAALLADDVHCFLQGESIAARPESRLARAARRIRRRPLLSAAIAVATLSTIALLGGGMWMLSERAAAECAAKAARDATDRAAEVDLNEADDLLRKSSWPEARAALERAKGRLGDRGSDILQSRLNQGNRDLELADRLDTIRQHLSDIEAGRISNLQCEQQYALAFREAGLGQVDDEPAAVAARVRRSNIQNALLATLDHWSELVSIQGRKIWLLDVARRADQDTTGWRDRARDPYVRINQAALEKLVATAPVAQESVTLLLALHRDLPSSSQEKQPLLKRIQESHPDDFWANLALGYALLDERQAGEAIRYFQAATAIRPRFALGCHDLGLALRRASLDGGLDRRAEAVEQFRRALAIDPAISGTRTTLAMTLTEMGRNDEAIEEIHLALHQEPKGELLYSSLGYCLEAKGRFAEAEAAHRQAVLLAPQNASSQVELRRFLLKRGRLEDARVAWQSALALNPPGHDAWYGYAELCLYLGHEEEYRRGRSALLTTFGATKDVYIAERTSRACLLLPETDDDLHRAVELAQRIAGYYDPSRTKPPFPPFLFAQGLAEYRLGRFDRAISLMRGDQMLVLGPPPRLVLAMALHQSGQAAEARKTFAAAVLAYDWRASKVQDQDGCICHVLRREAERMISPNLPAFLEGKHDLKDPDERLGLLGVCQFTNRTLALSRLYAAAFAADRHLAEDFQHDRRSNAACCAAQAGCGQGADAAGLGELERAKLRAQAREWLRADLAGWRMLTNAFPAAHEIVRQKLTQWRAEPDLACLREPAELEKLPADERNDCLALWDEIRMVLDKCGPLK